MVKLYAVKYRKSSLAAVPPDERLLHLMMQQLANDLSMMQRLMIIYLQESDDEPELSRSARTAMALMVAKLLAGRLYEAWNLLKKPMHSKVYARYRQKLPSSATSAFEEVKRYFNDSNNLIARVRNKLAFHSDVKLMESCYNDFPESEQFKDFLAEGVGNTFYQGAYIVSSTAMQKLSGEPDFAVAIGRFMDEVLKVGRWIVDYIQEFMVKFVLQYINPDWTSVQNSVLEVAGPRLADFHAPFFCEASAADVPGGA